MLTQHIVHVLSPFLHWKSQRDPLDVSAGLPLPFDTRWSFDGGTCWSRCNRHQLWRCPDEFRWPRSGWLRCICYFTAQHGLANLLRQMRRVTSVDDDVLRGEQRRIGGERSVEPAVTKDTWCWFRSCPEILASNNITTPKTTFEFIVFFELWAKM